MRATEPAVISLNNLSRRLCALAFRSALKLATPVPHQIPTGCCRQRAVRTCECSKATPTPLPLRAPQHAAGHGGAA